MCLLACPGCCSSPTLVAEDPRHETTSAARRRSPHSHGPPVASRAPRQRRRYLTAPRTACRPPDARSRGRGPATTSAARREVGITTVCPSPRELRAHARANAAQTPPVWSPGVGGRFKSKKNIGEPEACTVLRVWQTQNMNLSILLSIGPVSL